MAHSRLLICLFLDFDGTLTRNDTMHLVANAGYDYQGSVNRQPPPRAWDDIVQAYMADFKAHTDTDEKIATANCPSPKHRTTIAAEIEYLNSLKPIEVASARRAYEAGIWTEMPAAQISAAATKALETGELQLRPGWDSLFATVMNHNRRTVDRGFEGPPCHILSVNWSRRFITATIQAAMAATIATCRAEVSNGNTSISSPSSPSLTYWPWNSEKDLEMCVHSNEIPSIAAATLLSPPSPLSSPSDTWAQITTSGDKLKAMRSIMGQIHGHGRGGQTLSIYVGDSSTDLECLLEADVGICIRDGAMGSGQRALAETCDRVGVEVVHIGDDNSIGGGIDEKPQTQSRQLSRTKLYWVGNLYDIVAWLQNFFKDP